MQFFGYIKSVLFLLIISFPVLGQVAVICHPQVSENEIDKIRLLDFYSGDILQWDDGTPVILVDLKEKGKVKNSFYDFLGKSTSRMKSIWMRNMLSGESDPPLSIKDETEIVSLVAKTPGAIAFINMDKVDKSVKLLAEIPFTAE